MTDPIFPNGIRVFPPNEGAPDFVKGALSIETNKFCAWLGQQPDPMVRLDIKLSRNGKWYLQLNTWVPNGKKEAAKSVWVNPAEKMPEVMTPDELPIYNKNIDDDIPF